LWSLDCVQNVGCAAFLASDVSRSSAYVEIFASDVEKELEHYNSSKSVDYLKLNLRVASK